MSRKRISLGQRGEKYACQYLVERGYKILERNFRCRMGELDIIALDKDTIVFVEVRSRSSERFGGPLESINYSKQKKVRMLASYYLQSFYKKGVEEVRFDVMAVKFSVDGEISSLEHIKYAF